MKFIHFVLAGALILAGLAPTGAGPEALRTLKAISEAQADLYDRVASSVVRIKTTQVVRGDLFHRSPHDSSSDEDILNPFEFFHRRDRDSENPHGMWEFESGIGSGVVVRVDEGGAWILTNNHVIEDASKAEIEFTEGRPIEGLELIGDPRSPDRNTFVDWRSDLALIRIPKETLGERNPTPASFGDSDRLRTGEIVFTLGAPLDRESTFSQGIVSGKGRGDVFPKKYSSGHIIETRYESLIQTTAFINVGNSGGPLLDVEGNVVGINVAIQTAGGFSNGFIGIGFAIPSNRAVRVVDQLIQCGHVVRGFLGVMIETTFLGDDYPAPHPYRAVLIEQVGPGSPAEKGGLEEDDIILSFNGTTVRSMPHLQEMIALAPIDEPAVIEVFRGKERMSLDVPVGVQPDEMALAEVATFYSPELGATLRNTKAKEADYFEAKGGFKGVWIVEVDVDGSLQEGDVRIPPGSLITEIEYNPVGDLDELQKILDDLRARSGDKKEKLVMLKYVSGSSGDVEKFQVVRLRIE